MECCRRPESAHPLRFRGARSARGYTVIELMLVLGLVLAISAASVPVFQRVADDAAAAMAERAVESAVRAAQHEAASRGVAIAVEVVDGGAAVRLVLADGVDGDGVEFDDDAGAGEIDVFTLGDARLRVGEGIDAPGRLATALPTREVIGGDAIELVLNGVVRGVEVGSRSGGSAVRFVDVAVADEQRGARIERMVP